MRQIATCGVLVMHLVLVCYMMIGDRSYGWRMCLVQSFFHDLLDGNTSFFSFFYGFPLCRSYTFLHLKIMIGGLHSLGASDNILLHPESIENKKGTM